MATPKRKKSGHHDGGPVAPLQGAQFGDQNVQSNYFYFAPGNTALFGNFERLKDVCFDPSVLERDLDLSQFTGREWLIEQIDRFIHENDRGYVILRGEAGVGKSCLAARLVGTRRWMHHFTELPGGRSAAAARKSLAAQLIARWGLSDWALGGAMPTSAGRTDWFARVLHAAAEQRDASEPGERIVLVVDGLDEAEEEHGGDLPLGLPRSLPDGVYVIATNRFGFERSLHPVRRPYNWLEIEVDGASNLEDMRRFIDKITDPQEGDQRLVGVLATSGMDMGSFRSQLADRCAGVWIYLRYVLDEIRDKIRDPSEVSHLPDDLAGYYARQIERWRGSRRGSMARRHWDTVLLPLLGLLGAARAALTVVELATFARVPESMVRAFVEESARAFLNRQDDDAGVPRYSVRHQSLRDLLTGTAPDARPDVTDLAKEFGEQSRRAHRRITETLTPPGVAGERAWSNARTYATHNLAAHAAECDMLDDLISDPGFLAMISPGSALAQRANLRTAEGRRAIEAFEMCLSGWGSCTNAERAERLAFNAAKMRASSLLKASARMTMPDWPISWAAWSGRGHHTLADHDGWVRAVAVGRSGDREIIVSGTVQGTVRIWDAVTGDLVAPLLAGHEGPVLGLTIGRAGGRDIIVSGSQDGTIRVWDAVTGGRIGPPLTGHEGPVLGVTVGHAIGRDIIVSGSQDGTIRVWDAATGQPIGQPFAGHGHSVWSVAMGQAGGRDIIVSGSEDQTVRIWDAATGRPIGQPLTGHASGLWSVAIGRASDRDIIVSGSHDRTVRIWDAATGQPIGQPLAGHVSGVGGVAVGRAGDRDIIVSGSNDHTVRIWDASTRQPVGPPLTGHDDTVRAVAVGQAGGRDIIVSGSNDRTVRIWDAATREQADELRTGHNGSVRAVVAAHADDRDIIVSGSNDRSVRIWDAATGEPLGRPLVGHRGAVLAVAACRAEDREIIISGSEDQTVRIWDAATGEPLGRPLVGHRGAVLAVAACRAEDREIIISGSEDQTVRIWDGATGQPVGPPLLHDTAVRAIATGRAGNRDIIVSGTSGGILRIWEARSREPVGPPFAAQHGWLRAVAAGKAGERDIIVVGTLNGGIQVWDAITAQPLRQPRGGHAAPVLAVAVGHADNRDVVVSGDVNGTLLVWDAVTGQSVGPLPPSHNKWILSVAVGWAGDHDIIVSSSHDRTLFVYAHR